MRSRGSRWLPAGIHLAGLLLVAGGAQAAPTVAQKCQSGKNIAAGKYSDCGQKAEAKFAQSLDGAKRTLDRTRCEARLQATWTALEAKAVAQGGPCPSVGDLTPVRAALGLQTDTLATALAGTGEPAPPQAQRLKTRQTNCYEAVFPYALIPCAGTGQDGEYQRGVALSYRDPGVGTVEDTRTGLTWEKQSWDSSVHDHGLDVLLHQLGALLDVDHVRARPGLRLGRGIRARSGQRGLQDGDPARSSRAGRVLRMLSSMVESSPTTRPGAA